MLIKIERNIAKMSLIIIRNLFYFLGKIKVWAEFRLSYTDDSLVKMRKINSALNKPNWTPCEEVEKYNFVKAELALEKFNEDSQFVENNKKEIEKNINFLNNWKSPQYINNERNHKILKGISTNAYEIKQVNGRLVIAIDDLILE